MKISNRKDSSIKESKCTLSLNKALLKVEDIYMFTVKSFKDVLYYMDYVSCVLGVEDFNDFGFESENSLGFATSTNYVDCGEMFLNSHEDVYSVWVDECTIFANGIELTLNIEYYHGIDNKEYMTELRFWLTECKHEDKYIMTAIHDHVKKLKEDYENSLLK